MAVFHTFRGAKATGQFYGNNRKNITDISVSGSIAVSRTEGLLPAFVMVSASNITATGTDRPYEDLEYTWDFGDPTGNEVFVNPVTNRNENMNNQRGPEAAYCYRTAGVKTITLSIRGRKTDGTYVTQSTQATFTAKELADDTSAWTHYYFDSNASVDGDGTSPASPWNDPQHLLWNNTPSLRGKFTGYRSAVHIKRGSVINCTADKTMYIYAGWLRVDAYGTGDKPIITGTSLNNHNGSPYATILSMNANQGQGSFGVSVNPGEVVISDIAFHRLDSDKCIALYTLNQWPAYIHDVYFDNCEFNSAIYLLTSPGSGNLNNEALINCGFWGGKLIRNPNIDVDNFPGNIGNWFFLNGVQWENTEASTGGDTVLTHSIYVTANLHTLWKNILFQPTGLQNQLKMSINTNIDNGRWHLISNCLFQGSDGIAPGRSNEVSGFLNYTDFIIEGNLFINTRAVGCDMEDPQWYTIRDNYFGKATSHNGAIRTRTACFEETGFNIYRNKFYGPMEMIQLTNFGWDDSFPCQITDNTFWNTTTANNDAANAINIVTADQQAAGTLIDGNQYYTTSNATNPPTMFAPGGGNSAFGGDSVRDTLAQWQARGWDANGTYLSQAPAWPDPANGDFGQR